ncbi:MAG: hypothetical protein LC107_09650 [Chitinophagales bacterium]|nr:hypothetical protein [Chitinophagales bacterium]
MMSFIKKTNKNYPLFILLTVASFFVFQSCGNSESDAKKAEGSNENTSVQNPQDTQSQGSQVFHYTCPNGHNHGADNIGGSCPECGGQYVHNDAFHANDNANMQPIQPIQQPNPTTPTIQMEGPKNGVYHYICPNGHEGGGDNIGSTCAVCGTSLVHNDAYHN